MSKRHRTDSDESTGVSRVDGFIARYAPGWAVRRQKARIMLASYRAVDSSRRRRTPRRSGGSGDDQTPATTLWKLREDCRELERDNIIAKGILDRFVSSTVGRGFSPQAMTDDPGWNHAGEAFWRNWAQRDCDVRGVLSLRRICNLVIRSIARDGDVGAILTEDGRIQPQEADRLGTPISMSGEKNIVNGIRMNRVGRPVSYFVGDPQHGYVREATEIAARDFIHIYDPLRFTQSRGVPAFAPALDYLSRTDEYLSNELEGSSTSSLLALFIAQAQAGEEAYNNAETETDDDDNPYYTEKIHNGTVMYGLPGEEPKVISGNRPNQNFPEFMKLMMRFLGMTFGLPLEITMLDFSDSNYSAGRAAMMLAHDAFRAWQDLLVEDFLSRLWSWRIGMAIRDRVLPPIEKALVCKWQRPGWRYLDPEKEAKGKILQLEHGLSNLSLIASELGYDWEELLVQRAVELKRAKEIADAHGVDVKDLIGPAKAPNSSNATEEEDPDVKK